MKKSLLAVAVLGAFAANAMAADVTLYGKVDTGFMYSNTKKGDAKAVNKFEMKSGMAAGSRWGLKGSEDLGNGYKVGFLLESAFDSDTGVSKDRLFHREASVSVSGPFGTVYAGRMGGVGGGSASSPISLWGMGSAFGTTWGNNALTVTLQSNADRYDNSLAYTTPVFGGFQAIAFYSMGGDSVKNTSGKENSEEVDRYYGLGGKYINGPIAVFGVVDQMNYTNGTNYDNKDSLGVTIGGSYDFGVAKVYATAQYFDNLMAGNSISKAGLAVKGGVGQQEGFAVSLSANIPLAGGNFKAQLGYADAEDIENSDLEAKRYVGGIGYQYPLSKRTFVYAGASYMHDQHENKSSKYKEKTAQVFAGLNHSF